jgi:hypothetical protein
VGAATALAADLPWLAEVARGGIDASQKMLASPCTNPNGKSLASARVGGSMNTQKMFCCRRFSPICQ